MLDNRYAILLIRGERPVQDFKYDILRHPNVGGSTDGKGEPFDHGATSAVATISLMGQPKPLAAGMQEAPGPSATKPGTTLGAESSAEPTEPSCILFDQDDLEIYYKIMEDKKRHEKHQNTPQ